MEGGSGLCKKWQTQRGENADADDYSDDDQPTARSMEAMLRLMHGKLDLRGRDGPQSDAVGAQNIAVCGMDFRPLDPIDADAQGVRFSCKFPTDFHCIQLAHAADVHCQLHWPFRVHGAGLNGRSAVAAKLELVKNHRPISKLTQNV